MSFYQETWHTHANIPCLHVYVYLSTCICIHVYMYVCVYVCTHLIQEWLFVREVDICCRGVAHELNETQIPVYIYIYIYMPVCMYTYGVVVSPTSLTKRKFLYVCMYVWIHVRVYVYMYECIYMHIYVRDCGVKKFLRVCVYGMYVSQAHTIAVWVTTILEAYIHTYMHTYIMYLRRVIKRPGAGIHTYIYTCIHANVYCTYGTWSRGLVLAYMRIFHSDVAPTAGTTRPDPRAFA